MTESSNAQWPTRLIVAISIASIAAGLLAMAAVFWLAPNAQTISPPGVAQSALRAAQDGDVADVRARVASGLPTGAQAAVSDSTDAALQITPPSVPSAVAVVAASNRESAEKDLSRHGTLAVAQSDSWWVAVAVPTPASVLPAALAAGVITAIAGTGAGAFAVEAARRRWIPVPAPAAHLPRHQAPEIPPVTETSEPVAETALPDLLPRVRELTQQRANLVRGLAELAGQMPEELVWQANNTLLTADVHLMAPDGDRFDPALHRAVGTEPAKDPARAETVARTVRPGYADAEQVLVPPRVVIYTADAEHSESSS